MIFDSELHFGTQLFCPLGTAAEEIYIPPEVQVTENHDGWQQPISPSQPHQSGLELSAHLEAKKNRLLSSLRRRASTDSLKQASGVDHLPRTFERKV